MMIMMLMLGCDPSDHRDNADEALSAGEQYLVGVWRGEMADDDWSYLVLNADRTGCEWVREGDDFANRFDELHFFDWRLDEENPDAEGRLMLSFEDDSGYVYDRDRYEPATDRLMPSGFASLSMGWRSIEVRCEDSGTDAIRSDVERQGEPIVPEERQPDGNPPGGPG